MSTDDRRKNEKVKQIQNELKKDAIHSAPPPLHFIFHILPLPLLRVSNVRPRGLRCQKPKANFKSIQEPGKSGTKRQQPTPRPLPSEDEQNQEPSVTSQLQEHSASGAKRQQPATRTFRVRSRGESGTKRQQPATSVFRVSSRVPFFLETAWWRRDDQQNAYH